MQRLTIHRTPLCLHANAWLHSASHPDKVAVGTRKDKSWTTTAGTVGRAPSMGARAMHSPMFLSRQRHGTILLNVFFEQSHLFCRQLFKLRHRASQGPTL